MSKPAPVVYILHGDDEYAINCFIDEIETRLGDPAAAMMNITRLDGRSLQLEELRSVVNAVPFLTRRRLVVLTHPRARLNSPAEREKFISLLEQIPQSTALILVENHPLTSERDKRRGEIHWLEAWAGGNKELAFVRVFHLPKGGAMGRWIQEQAQSTGGSFTPQAAVLLASLVGEDTRLVDQEIQKLLAYVNYMRPVEPEDVEKLTAVVAQGDIFAMVDALGNQDGKSAIGMLHRLLELQDPLSIFGMVVRQFRLLLLARDVMDRGGGPAEMVREYDVRPKLHPYVAEKACSQARSFSIDVLEHVYHHLLDIDEAIKTGNIQSDLALDTFVADFTSQQRRGSFH